MPYLLLVLTVLFWSGNFVVGRGIHESISPVAFAFWRWSFALLILLPLTARSLYRSRQLIRRNAPVLIGLAVLSVTNFSVCIYHALSATTVVNAVLVNSTTPIIIAVIAWAAFADRLSYRQAIGVAISLFGLVWIISRGHPEILLDLQFSSGDLWTLGAATSWAFYTVLLRKRPEGLAPLPFLAILVLFGVIGIFPIYLWELRSGATFQWTPGTLVGIAYVAVFPSILSYYFWNKAVAVVGPNRAGIFVHLMPVFAILLAYIFLDETLDRYHIIGMVLIFSGIYLTTARRVPLLKG